MSLKRDNFLLKDFDFENDPEKDQIYQGYKSAELPGSCFKSALNYLLKIYKGCCGEGAGVNRIYDVLAQYIRVNATDENFAFYDEAAKLQDLYLFANDYAGELDELDQKLDAEINIRRGSGLSNKPIEKQRAADMKFVAQSVLLFSRRSLVHTVNACANSLMCGCLEYEDARDTNGDGSSLGAFELPLFTHIPFAEDLSNKDLSESKLMQILYNIAEKDPYAVMRMMHDCGSGKVIVRLWKKENGADKACLFVLPKRDVYIERIAYKGEKSLWPGLIETAIRSLGCPQEEIPYAVLGPELEKFDLTALSGPNDPDAHRISESHNEILKEYIMCYYDTYSALLWTQNILLKETPEYIRLTVAVWEVIYALVCCLGRSIDIADPAIEFLRSVIEDYKGLLQENPKSDPAARKVISICGTLEALNKLGKDGSEYKDKPRRYFEKNLASKVAGVILRSMREEETPQSLKEKTEAVLNSKTFRSRAAKINIHVMNTASEEYAASLLEKMKDR